jgi:hypothetical protein
VTYPQIHDTLFYVDRKDPQGPEPTNPASDPQFKQWEESVLAWASANVPGFLSMNQPLPPGSVASGENAVALSSPLSVSLNTPSNGTFVSGPISVSGTIKSSAAIDTISLYLNGALIESHSGAGNSLIAYSYAFSPLSLEPQNELRLVARDTSNRIAEASVIIFKSL